MLQHTRELAEAPARTVVLGGTGFVGGALCARLAREGAEHVSIGRGELDLLSDAAGERLAARLAPGDALVVISAEAPCRDVPGLLRNVRMVAAVCDALARTPVEHVLYVSSDAVYCDDANPVVETSCRDPGSLHGAMHATRETMLRATLRAPLAILRPTLIYGAADPHDGYGPNRFRRQAARGEPIVLGGEGEERRDHVHVDDVARVAWLALARRSRGVLNVATGRSHSFREVAERVVACFDPPVPVRGTPRKTPITHRHFDVTELVRAFPGLGLTPLEEGVPRVHLEAKASRGS